MATEIYICKPGQPLKEGRVEYSHHIDHRDDAEADAKARCTRDKSIGKVAYYRVSDDGNFRCFYTYTNPDAKDPSKPAGPAKKKRRKKRPPPKKTLVQKIVGVFKD